MDSSGLRQRSMAMNSGRGKERAVSINAVHALPVPGTIDFSMGTQSYEASQFSLKPLFMVKLLTCVKIHRNP